MVVTIVVSFVLLTFLSCSVGAIIEMVPLRRVRLGRLRHRCRDLDPESAQHRQSAVERLKSFAGLDAGQTSPVEAELESIDHLLLSESLSCARVAQHPAEVSAGANPIVLCAHINTEYRDSRMCQ